MVIRGRAITTIKKEQRNKKLRRQAIISSLILLNASIYAGVTALALHLPIFRITATRIDGVTGVRKTEVNDETVRLLNEKKWYIFPKHTTIYSLESMIARLQEVIPWIEEASITTESPHVLHLQITERKPAYIVCDNDEACYYADVNTIVFAPAPIFSDSVYPKLRNANTPSVQLMLPVFTPIISEMISDLITALNDLDITTVLFEETEEDSYRIYTKDGWYIFFAKGETVSRITESIKSTMKSARFALEYKRRPRSLEYIDVRLVDKVFYKFSASNSYATTTRNQ